MISEDELDDDIILGDDAAEGADGTLYEHFRIVADQGQVALRIDKFLTEHMPHSSRNRIQAAADAGYIFVGDQLVAEATFTGQMVRNK